MLRILLSCFFAFTAILLFAQSKETIAFGYSAKTADNISDGDVSMYENAALSGTRNPNLCIVLERNQWANIMKEKSFQKSEEFLHGKVTPQGEAIGADYVILIDIQSADIKDDRSRSESKNKDGSISVSYSRTVSYSVILGVSIVAVKDGQIKHSKTLPLVARSSASDKNGNFPTSKEEVAGSLKPELAKNCCTEFARFMYEVFPPEVKFLQVEEVKREKAERVLCSSSSVLPKNGVIEIFTEENIAGYTRQKEIGRLRVIEMQGDHLVFCDVIKGGEEILLKTTAKSPIKCKSNLDISAGYFRQMQISCD